MTTHLHYAASTYVFRLLGRGRAKAQRLPGSALDGALAALREEGQNALIEVELPNGSLGRLLVQVGRPVFVQYESKFAEAALAELRAGTAEAHLYLLRLSDEQIIFACAALRGIPLALGETLPTGTEPLSALLRQLGQQSFTGVVALEQGLQTLIWRFQRGRVLNNVALPGKLRVGRLTQLVWQEQLLPEIGEPKARTETAQIPAQVSTPPSAQVSARTSANPASSAQLEPIRATISPTLPASPVPPAPTRTTAQAHTAQAHTVQNPASQVTTSQPAASQPAVSQPKPPQMRFGSDSVPQGVRESRRKTRLEPDTEEVWTRFQEVVSTQLGSRGERVFKLIQGELGGFSRAELIGRLTLQVERIAGSAAARNFRDSF